MLAELSRPHPCFYLALGRKKALRRIQNSTMKQLADHIYLLNYYSTALFLPNSGKITRRFEIRDATSLCN